MRRVTPDILRAAGRCKTGAPASIDLLGGIAWGGQIPGVPANTFPANVAHDGWRMRTFFSGSRDRTPGNHDSFASLSASTSLLGCRFFGSVPTRAEAG